MNKLNLYWWNAKTNVGDFASYYIISKLFNGKIKRKDPTLTAKCFAKCAIGREPFSVAREYVMPFERYISGVGSIIDHLNNQAFVWGTGCRSEGSLCPIKARYYGVRGYMTLDVLKRLGIETHDIAIGDPALLLPLLYKPRNTSSNAVVVIPHYNDFNDIHNRYNHLYNILDVRTNDLEAFIDKLSKAKIVVSSSLHGLIFANAYNIPSVWFKHNYVNSSDFKFYDYLSSIGKSNYVPLEYIYDILDKKEQLLALQNSPYCIHSSRNTIQSLQEGIRGAWAKLVTEY